MLAVVLHLTDDDVIARPHYIAAAPTIGDRGLIPSVAADEHQLFRRTALINSDARLRTFSISLVARRLRYEYRDAPPRSRDDKTLASS